MPNQASTNSPQYKARIKVWLLQGKKLTPMIAWSRWKCTRLAVYIHRLRKDGFRIESTIKYNKNGTQYSEYRHTI